MMSPRCSTEVNLLRKKLVEEIARKARQLSDEDYKKFMDFLKECIAQGEKGKKKKRRK